MTSVSSCLSKSLRKRGWSGCVSCQREHRAFKSSVSCGHGCDEFRQSEHGSCEFLYIDRFGFFHRSLRS